MAVVNGYTTTSQNDLVGNKFIELLAEGVPAQARAYTEVALVRKAPLGHSTYNIIVNDTKSVNATLTETDEADWTEFTTSQVAITPAVYPVVSMVSMELQQDAIDIDVMQKAAREHFDVLANAADANVFANISNASNTTDHNGTSMTLAKLLAIQLLLKKQSGRDAGEIVFVGSYRQVHEIVTDATSQGATVFGVAQMAADAASKNPGEVGPRVVQGIPCYEANVPASGGADVSGALMVRGKALAIAFFGEQAMSTRPFEPDLRFGTGLKSHSRYGTGIIRQANLREVISLA